MKVYELITILAGMPSGADVLCSSTFTVDELKRCENIGNNGDEDDIYSFAKNISDVEKNIEDIVYINF